MSEEQSKSKLAYPLPKPLVEYIKQEEPKLGLILISAIEFTIKESNNHYIDVLKSVEPLLKENAKNFVSKLFIFKKRPCRAGNACTQPNCIFTHDDMAEDSRQKHVHFDFSNVKKSKIDNNEVVFNKIDESRFTLEDIREYANKYGVVNSLRRLNRGKYLIIFDTTESAQKLVDCAEMVLGDSMIKKFYNVNVMPDQYKKPVDISALLHEQRDILNRLSIFYDKELFEDLKEVTNKIRNHILFKDNRPDNNKFVKRERAPMKQESNTESSLYYNMFAD